MNSLSKGSRVIIGIIEKNYAKSLNNNIWVDPKNSSCKFIQSGGVIPYGSSNSSDFSFN